MKDIKLKLVMGGKEYAVGATLPDDIKTREITIDIALLAIKRQIKLLLED
jgi:hypothetical protein